MTGRNVLRSWVLAPPRLISGRVGYITANLGANGWLVAGLLALGGLAVRLLNIGSAPLDFHAVRQYRSMIIARDIYFDLLPSVPDWQREVAEISRSHQGTLEPPILETIVAGGWRLVGGEALWVPALLSSVMWVVGGLFLYAIVRRIADSLSALFAIGLYLFLPFAVVASRSFQPDPFMVMLLLASVWALVRHDQAPSQRGLMLAAAISTLAFTVQPRTVLVIGAVFLLLAWNRNRGNLSSWRRDLMAYLPIAALPFAAVYGYMIISGAFRTDIARAILLPQLWLDPFFYRGWVSNIGASVGFVAFTGALVGTLLFRPGAPTALVLGLWSGYVAFGFAFNFAVASHDYYQLQAVPIVAIALAPVLAAIVRHVEHVRPGVASKVVLGGVLAIALALLVVDARARTSNPGWQDEVALREAIGEAVEHSPRTIFLAGDYGVPLEFHGLLSGIAWPMAADAEWERLSGLPVLSASERFESSFAGAQPEYFIVQDLEQLAQQPDLEQLLYGSFPVVRSTDEYLIFDLTP